MNTLAMRECIIYYSGVFLTRSMSNFRYAAVIMTTLDCG